MHDLYREHILEHYKHPLNFGHLKNPDVTIDDRNSTCGDVIHLELKIDHEKKIQEDAFTSDGCAISRASASLLTEDIKGKKTDELATMTHEHIFDLLGAPISSGRINCALLPLAALKKAVQKINT